MLTKTLEQQGNFLFRWRSYVPLVLFVVLFLNLDLFTPFGGDNNSFAETVWENLCVLISFSGFLIRCITIGQIPKSTSGRNTNSQIADTLNTKGIYSIVRNPLYLGNFFMYLGICLFLHIWLIVIIFLSCFALYYERIIYAEEKYLYKKFGKEYEDWSQKTSAFFPTFRNYEKTSLKFSFRNVLKREYHGFFAMVGCFFTVEFVSYYYTRDQSKGLAEFLENFYIADKFWIIALCCSFAAWAAIRYMSKKTSLLNVEGR